MYSYDTVGRLTNYEGTSPTLNSTFPAYMPKFSGYTFDANGNVKGRAGRTLWWDVQNHLVRVDNGSTIEETYLYDPDGQRVKKTVGSSNLYYPFAHYELAGSTITKYYFFAGQRHPGGSRMRKGGTLYYLHADQLGSIVTTTEGATTVHQLYCAYGRQRTVSGGVSSCPGGNSLPTGHTFTGQKLDGTGLQYYNARYYDPAIGTFISPDTIVPDATNVFGYNRYMYGFGNPLKFNDPTGHCVNSTTTNKDVEITYDNDECWRIANTIGAMWDDTDYWRTRFTSPEVFFNSVANNAHNGVDFFQGQLTNFLHSEEGATWLAGIPDVVRPEQDFGDYTAIKGGVFIFDFALIMDDHRQFYLSYGNSYSVPGLSIVRGDILANTEAGYKDIDQLDISWEEKSAIMKNALTGEARSVASGYPFITFRYSTGINPPYYRLVEGGVFISPSPVSLGFSPLNTTFSLNRR